MSNHLLRISSFSSFPASVNIFSCTLSKAGFYYTGHLDEVRCYSCGLTNKHWKSGDNPSDIQRHKSPDCSYVKTLNSATASIDRKSNDFEDSSMQKQETLNSNLRSPLLSSFQASLLNISEPLDVFDKNDTSSFPSCSYQHENTGNRFIGALQVTPDQSEEEAYLPIHSPTRLETADREFASQHKRLLERCAIKHVMSVGYKEDDVMKALTILKLRHPDDTFLTATNILGILLDYEHDINAMEITCSSDTVALLNEETVLVTNAPINENNGTALESLDKIKLIKENKELRFRRLCKVCLDSEVSVVLLPCGHMCCPNCAFLMKTCPICRIDVKGTLNTSMT